MDDLERKKKALDDYRNGLLRCANPDRVKTWSDVKECCPRNGQEVGLSSGGEAGAIDECKKRIEPIQELVDTSSDNSNIDNTAADGRLFYRLLKFFRDRN